MREEGTSEANNVVEVHAVICEIGVARRDVDFAPKDFVVSALAVAAAKFALATAAVAPQSIPSAVILNCIPPFYCAPPRYTNERTN